MFYITPVGNTCLDLKQVLMFNYCFDEETKEIDKKSLIITFKTGYAIKLEYKSKEIAYEMFCDLCKYLNVINPANKPRKNNL